MAKRESALFKNKRYAVETSESINRQTTDFLNMGGKIEYVKSGVSGLNPKTGKKQIDNANQNTSTKPAANPNVREESGAC